MTSIHLRQTVNTGLQDMFRSCDKSQYINNGTSTVHQQDSKHTVHLGVSMPTSISISVTISLYLLYLYRVCLMHHLSTITCTCRPLLTLTILQHSMGSHACIHTVPTVMGMTPCLP